MNQRIKDRLKAVELVTGRVTLTPEVTYFFDNELNPFIKKLIFLSTKKNIDALALTTTVIVSIFRRVNEKNKILLLQELLESLSNEDELTEKSKIAIELVKRMEAERGIKR